MLETLFATLLLATAALAQPAPPVPEAAPAAQPVTSAAAATPDTTVAPLDAFTTLNAILGSLERLDGDLRDARRQLTGRTPPDQQGPLLARVGELRQRLEAQERSFEEIATGVVQSSLEQRRGLRFDWAEELQEILGPIIYELRSLTERPREIERLRREIDYLERLRRPALARGSRSLEDLRTRLRAAPEAQASRLLLRRLDALATRWVELQQQADNDLTVTRHQLAEKVGKDRPLLETAHTVVAFFFKSRGQNLLFAILVLVLVLGAFRLLHRFVRRSGLFQGERRRSFEVRLLEVLIHTATFVGASGAFLVVLYLSADWVLLGLSAIFLLGVAWAASKGLPTYWVQTQLLLNLGTVREGERLVWRGLPWRVQSINIYTELANPELRGGTTRLPLRDLVDLRSRPEVPDEPWFPCREGDWLVLPDGTRGCVALQTPDVVRLRLYGGTTQDHAAAAFLTLGSKNLSRGFGLALTFGLDYAHAAQATEAIPRALEAFLRERLAAAPAAADLRTLTVEFKEPSSSSLDLLVLADFDGAAAPRYGTITRLLFATAVDACTKHGWGIPFPQLTVHQAGSKAA